jgi:hypothetical protein
VSTEAAPAITLDAHIYPQPAHGQAQLQVTLPETGRLSVRLFGAQGQEVSSIPTTGYPAGTHEIALKLTGSPGLYLCRVEWEAGRHKDIKTLKVVTF